MPSFTLRPVDKTKVAKKKFKAKKNIRQKIAKRFLKILKEEIKKEIEKRKSLVGDKKKEGLPDSREFANSFYLRLPKNGGFEIYTDWPFIDRHLEGRDPYEMKWLRGGNKRNPKFIPITDKETGQLTFRRMPFQSERAWIHPGVEKSNFVERAMERLDEELEDLLTKG